MKNEKEKQETDLVPVGYVEFEFDLPAALLARLVDVFESLRSEHLNEAALSGVPDEQGVYQLFHDERLVYVGKTDGDAGLKSRLFRHATKIKQRKNLSPSSVRFKAVRIFVFTAMDLETDLIRHYGGVKQLDWNGSGFGSNDPGKERDTTRVKASNFDARYPIDVDVVEVFEIQEGESAAEVLTRLKTRVPYTLRFENSGGKSRRPHLDLISTKLSAFAGGITVRDLLIRIVSQLPSGWQATALPGYIIMYKNDKRTFPSGKVLAKSA